MLQFVMDNIPQFIFWKDRNSKSRFPYQNAGLKSFGLIASLSFALTVFIAEAAFSLPLPQETQPSEVAKSEVDVPICYMQTANGRILSLSRLCEQQPVDSGIRSALPSPSPYNASAIEKFDDELYGKGN